VRKAVQRAYGLPTLPSSKEVDFLGEKWRPHRSLATSYLYWRTRRLKPAFPATAHKKGWPFGST
jgi:3-methyladenine DNA glycosylase/8-oxoguanine DNA glycosylase